MFIMALALSRGSYSCLESWASTSYCSFVYPASMKGTDECNHVAFEDKRTHLLKKSLSKTTSFKPNNTDKISCIRVMIAAAHPVTVKPKCP